VGDSVYVDVGLLTHGTQPSAFVFSLLYDATKLDFVSLEDGEVVTEAGKQVVGNDLEGKLALYVLDDLKLSAAMEDGRLFTMRFEILGAAQPEDVLAIASDGTETAADPYAEDVPVHVTPGHVTVAQTARGSLGDYYTPFENGITAAAPGYTLPLDLDKVANATSVLAKLGALVDAADLTPLLQAYGFAVVDYEVTGYMASLIDRENIVFPYKFLHEADVPLFITTDTLLHLYHIQFDETLKDIEEREFAADLLDLTNALLADAQGQYATYAGTMKEAARRNVAFLAVARALLDPAEAVPTEVQDVVAAEVAKIDAHAGFDTSPLFTYREDYSQYVPRGHYTRSELLERYFKAFMWYGRMAFLLKGAEVWGPTAEALVSEADAKIQTLQAVLLATGLEAVDVDDRSGRDVWDRIYAITSFYVGLADDLTPYEYLEVLNMLFGDAFDVTILEDDATFFELKKELALLRSPQIYGGTGNIYLTPPITPDSLDSVLDRTKGMRFMGQRFIPDSYMFQHLVFPEVLGYTGTGDPEPFTLGETGGGPGRCYPRGLDAMALLGSELAADLLETGGDTDYEGYAERIAELEAWLALLTADDWHQNLYWGWLDALRALLNELPAGYPEFMRTEAWQKKGLNAALASWAELRHDTILYAKQSYTPGYVSVPPDVAGYVEPVPEFYGRLLALARMTREGLTVLDALSPAAAARLVSLEAILERLLELAGKELTNEELTADDHMYLRDFGDTLETTVAGVAEDGFKTTLVADVHTHGVEGRVVEEASGYVDLIVVACPHPSGGAFLAAGPVLSYYEFKQPMDDRLTDEAWRALLDSASRPDRPVWFQELVKGK